MHGRGAYVDDLSNGSCGLKARSNRPMRTRGVQAQAREKKLSGQAC